MGMKRTLFIAIISIRCLAFLAGCNDSGGIGEPQPDIVTGGATITKAELIDALWNEEVEVSKDVRCLINSSFKITSKTPFTIAKNTVPSDFNRADVVIVSDVNVNFDDPATDGRGGECGEGILQYNVSASESVPIDIEPATEIKARHSLVHMASGKHTAYPGCTIRAHFDKAGKVICDPALLEEEPEEEAPPPEEEAPPPEEETPPPDEETPQPEEDDDGVIFVPPEWLELVELKAQELSDDGVPCGTEEIHSVKMVIDDYNCQLQGITPKS
jgi:predicted small secreted protein